MPRPPSLATPIDPTTTTGNDPATITENTTDMDRRREKIATSIVEKIVSLAKGIVPVEDA